MIAASQPDATTRDVLKKMLQVPSAKKFFNDTASDQAKKRGEMSAREFEAFEVGRRYASTDWLSDLQQMDGQPDPGTHSRPVAGELVTAGTETGAAESQHSRRSATGYTGDRTLPSSAGRENGAG
ncbi:conjugal transfer protein TraW [Escherichia coli]